MAKSQLRVQDVAVGGIGWVEAGWYDDPWAEAVLRWWDGATWTGHVSNPTAPPTAPVAESPLDRLLVAGGRIAVVDVETTGLYNSDRVVEIAIVTMDEHGVIVDEFDTLVNPGRDVGPTWIHQVTASMVRDAPMFDEVAHHVAARLDGAVVAAHNVPFDRRMLNNELLRCGIDVDWGGGLDTLSATGCKLAVACSEFGITNSDAHRALSDARATAQLLLAVAHEFDTGCRVVTARPIDLTAAIRVCTRDGNANAPVPPPYLASLARGVHSHVDVAPYVDLLDRAIADLRLTNDERAELAALAAELGLDDVQVARAHRDFLNGMVDAALEDSVVTAEEYELLHRAAALLNVDVELVDRRTTSVRASTSELSLERGLTVCFTGAAIDSSGQEIDRTFLEGVATGAGLVPTRSVTRDGCDLLVAADPSTQSGKADKARKYGVPIGSVDGFLAAAQSGAPLAVSSVSTAAVALVCSKCGESWLAGRRSARPICSGCRSSAPSTGGAKPTQEPPTIETLTCETCGRSWERNRVRGRKPRSCDGCNSLTRDAPL